MPPCCCRRWPARLPWVSPYGCSTARCRLSAWPHNSAFRCWWPRVEWCMRALPWHCSGEDRALHELSFEPQETEGNARTDCFIIGGQDGNIEESSAGGSREIRTQARLFTHGQIGIRPCLPFRELCTWNSDPVFSSTYDSIRSNTLVDIYRCWELWSLVKPDGKTGWRDT